mgnify:CR=1 FL=1
MVFKKHHYQILSLLFVTLALAVSCTKKAIVVTAPKEYYVKPVFEEEYSTINFKAVLTTAEANEYINKYLPDTLYKDTNLEDDNYSVIVTKNEPFTIAPENDYFLITAPLKIAAKARLNVGFIKAEKEADFYINVKFKTKIASLPDWKLQTQTEPAGYEWMAEPKIKIGPLEVPVGQFLEKIIKDKQQEVAKLFDENASKYLVFRPLAEQIWKYVQTPLSVDKQMKIWATLQPQNVYFIPPYGDNQSIKAGIGMKAKIITTLGKLEESAPLSLPELSSGNNADSLFVINLVSKVSFKELEQLVNDKLTKAPFQFEEGKYKINISSVSFYGSGQKLIVKTLLTGDYTGNVYFSGEPQYDSVSNKITVKNFDFEPETKKMIESGYLWLMKGQMRKKIQEKLSLPVETYSKNAAATVTEYLNNLKIAEGIKMNCRIDRLAPQKVFVDDGRLIFSIKATGKAEMQLSLGKILVR